MNINVLSVIILSGRNMPDTVLITTDLPSPLWPFQPKGLVLKITCAAHTAKQYMTTNFPEVKNITEIKL